jgi:hypothetical protein
MDNAARHSAKACRELLVSAFPVSVSGAGPHSFMIHHQQPDTRMASLKQGQEASCLFGLSGEINFQPRLQKQKCAQQIADRGT